MSNRSGELVLIKGAGDLATGVAIRLHWSGFRVVMTELPAPTMVRRAVSFGEAVYDGAATVEGVTARLSTDVTSALEALKHDVIPVLVDPDSTCVAQLKPDVLVDAILAKMNTGTSRADASLVIALGPGFCAGEDCHAVVETNRGHWLGRVIWQGSAQPDTRVPGLIKGKQTERVLRAPATGLFRALCAIGDRVEQGQPVAEVGGVTLFASFAGIVRGLIHDGTQVTADLKVGDIDPRGEPSFCSFVSEKSLAIGGAVLEAILSWRNGVDTERAYDALLRSQSRI